MRKPDPETMKAKRRELQEAFDAGDLDIADAVREMRKMFGWTQAEYADKVGVAARAVIDLERRVGNPTLETILKMGKPFGLTVAYRSPRAFGYDNRPLIRRPLKTKYED